MSDGVKRDKRFRKSASSRTEWYTAQPSERRNSPWYVWDAASKDWPPKPVFVGEMEECQSVADALNAHHGDGW